MHLGSLSESCKAWVSHTVFLPEKAQGMLGFGDNSAFPVVGLKFLFPCWSSTGATPSAHKSPFHERSAYFFKASRRVSLTPACYSGIFLNTK